MPAPPSPPILRRTRVNSMLPTWIDDALRCPATGAALERSTREDGSVELVSTNTEGPRYAYPVTDGVPILLSFEARVID